MKKQNKLFRTKMENLAEATGLCFDGNDSRLFYDQDNIIVYAQIMSEEEYKKMIKALDFEIKGDGYTVYGWNDVSGYEYWTRDKEDNPHSWDSNYIQVTVRIENIDKVNPEQMKKDAEKVFNKFYYDYHNMDSVDFSRRA